MIKHRETLSQLLLLEAEYKRPVPYQWSQKGNSNWSARFEVEGAVIELTICISPGPSFYIAFTGRADLTTNLEVKRRLQAAGSHGVFNSRGGVIRILSTIIAAVREADETLKPVFASFAAAGSNNKSRGTRAQRDAARARGENVDARNSAGVLTWRPPQAEGNTRARIYQDMVQQFGANDWQMGHSYGSFNLVHLARKAEAERVSAARAAAAANQPPPTMVGPSGIAAPAASALTSPTDSRRKAAAVARRAGDQERAEVSGRGAARQARGLMLTTRGSRRMVSAFVLNDIPYWIQFDLHNPELDGSSWEQSRGMFERDVRSWAAVSFWINGQSRLVPTDVRRSMRRMTPTQLGRQVLEYGNPSELYGVFHEILVRFVKRWSPDGLEYFPPDPHRTALDESLLRRMPGSWRTRREGSRIIGERSGLPEREEQDEEPVVVVPPTAPVVPETTRMRPEDLIAATPVGDPQLQASTRMVNQTGPDSETMRREAEIISRAFGG